MNIINMTDPMSANGEERVGSLSEGRQSTINSEDLIS